MVGLNGRQLSALLTLRAKLVTRLFWREKGRIVSAIVTFLFFGPIVLGVAGGSALAYIRLEQPWPTQILSMVLVAMWAIWLVSPILFSGINEGADITRLLVFPITRRDLVASIFLGTLFDYPTYLMLPLFLAVAVGFAGVWPIVLLALLLGYGHMIIIGQLAQTLLGGILQSRRFRDVAIIVGSLVASTCYIWQIGIQRLVETTSESVIQEWLLTFRPLNALQWLPTGALARAVERAQFGEMVDVALWLFYSLLWLVLLTAVWWFLLERVTTGQGFLRLSGSAVPKEKKPRRQSQSRGLSLLPADIAELVTKELKSIWRVPQRRVGLIQGVLFPFVMMGAIFLRTESTIRLPSWFGLTLPVYAMFIFWALTQNMLAWEGHGLATLLLSPVPRSRIFVAKGLAFLLVGGTPFLLIALAMVIFTRSWQSVGGLITGLAVGLTTLGVTAVSSVLFPMRVNLEAKRTRRSVFSTGGGCLTGLAMVFLVPIIMALVAAPAVAPLGLAAWWERPLLGTLGALLAVFYGLFVFWGGNRLAGQLLLEREAEVYTTLKQPEFEE